MVSVVAMAMQYFLVKVDFFELIKLIKLLSGAPRKCESESIKPGAIRAGLRRRRNVCYFRT